MKHAKNFDRKLLDRQKKDAIIAHSETKLLARQLQLLNVAHTGGQIAVDGMQNAKGGFAIDGSKVSSSLGGPNDRKFGHGPSLARRQTELAKDILMRDALVLVK